MKLSPYDQSVYDAGFKYVPQSKYLLNPFQIPQAEEETEIGSSPKAPAPSGGDQVNNFNPYNVNMDNIRQDYNPYEARQAGEIYSKTFNPRSNDPTGSVANAQAIYNKAAQALASGYSPSYTDRSMFGKSLSEIQSIANDQIMDNKEQYGAQGQYVDPYDPRYSSMIEAQKFMDNYPEYYGVPSGVPEPGIPGVIKNYMQNSLLGKGLGIAKDFIGGLMPINERAIMENEARGAGIFTDDIGRIVTDDYNTAGGIMAGYNLNKIDAGTFDKRRARIEKTIADKKAKGLDTTALEERLGLLDEAEEDILGARKRTQIIKKLREEKRTGLKRKDDPTITDTGTTTSGSSGSGSTGSVGAQFGDKDYADPGVDAEENQPSNNITSSSSGVDNPYSGGPGGVQSGMSSASPGSKGPGGSDQMGSFAYGGRVYFMDGGRVYYMDGGIADLLEIYD